MGLGTQRGWRWDSPSALLLLLLLHLSSLQRKGVRGVSPELGAWRRGASPHTPCVPIAPGWHHQPLQGTCQHPPSHSPSPGRWGGEQGRQRGAGGAAPELGDRVNRFTPHPTPPTPQNPWRGVVGGSGGCPGRWGGLGGGPVAALSLGVPGEPRSARRPGPPPRAPPARTHRGWAGGVGGPLPAEVALHVPPPTPLRASYPPADTPAQLLCLCPSPPSPPEVTLLGASSAPGDPLHRLCLSFPSLAMRTQQGLGGGCACCTHCAAHSMPPPPAPYPSQGLSTPRCRGTEPPPRGTWAGGACSGGSL